MLTFGPVPSRRLGRSLGINNIPPKACSYSCRYCQVGPTRETEIQPRPFYASQALQQAVEAHLERTRQAGEGVDYLTFVPDGEPTLDARLPETIERLRPLGIPIAVISNASLIWREEVQQTLALADWVSFKVDAIDDELWRRINRPHPALDHGAILAGMERFASSYRGTLVTETMLLHGLNDTDRTAQELAAFLARLSPETAYLAVPTRPPAEPETRAPDEAILNRIYQLISQRFTALELLTGYEGNAFAATGDLVEDLLSITAVHPMREEAVRALQAKSGESWERVEELVRQQRLIPTEFAGERFYVRRHGVPDAGAPG